jgi:hypothetical protein
MYECVVSFNQNSNINHLPFPGLPINDAMRCTTVLTFVKRPQFSSPKVFDLFPWNFYRSL